MEARKRIPLDQFQSNRPYDPTVDSCLWPWCEPYNRLDLVDMFDVLESGEKSLPPGVFGDDDEDLSDELGG